MKLSNTFRVKKKGTRRYVKVSKRIKEDFLVSLKDRLEDEHIKKYTFIVKGSKMYTAGVFWSEKNKKKYVFRSAYEFAYFYQLENDERVTAYIVEPFEVSYICPNTGTYKIYRPDVLVSYRTGETKLIEIKPKKRITEPEVKAKAQAARDFLKLNFPYVKYEFITEDGIFKNPEDYINLLNRIDPSKKGPKQSKELDYFKSKLPSTMKYTPCMLI